MAEVGVTITKIHEWLCTLSTVIVFGISTIHVNAELILKFIATLVSCVNAYILIIRKK
jgi:hypothetical protein